MAHRHSSDKHDRRVVLLWVVTLSVVSPSLMSLLPAGSLLLGLMFITRRRPLPFTHGVVAQLIDQLHSDEVPSVPAV